MSSDHGIVKKLVTQLGLKPHPEGGFYREIYRSSHKISKSALPEIYSGDHAYSTCAYFLLPRGHVSVFHRLLSDEQWHFYLGGPLHLVQIYPNGEMVRIVLGSQFEKGEKFFHFVSSGCWFGAYPDDSAEFALVGVTVAPGFEFTDFEMADPALLKKKYPHASKMIDRLSFSERL